MPKLKDFEIEDEKSTDIFYVQGGQFYSYVINYHPNWTDSYYKYYWAKKQKNLPKNDSI